MKYEYANEFVSPGNLLEQELKKIFVDLLNKKYEVEGQPILIPADLDVEFKVKYKVTPEDDSLSIELSWEKAVEEEFHEDD